ncbi:MAG: urea ABC transporter permease subunit UrtB [Rhodospirillaceae bacterium]
MHLRSASTRGFGSLIRIKATLATLLLGLFLAMPLPGSPLGPAEAHAATVDDAALIALINALAEGKLKERAAAIDALTATGDARVAPALSALGEGDLYLWEPEERVVIAIRDGKEYVMSDPLTQEDLGRAPRNQVDKIRVNNRLRRAIRSALGALTLGADDPAVRLEAAESIFKSSDTGSIDALEAALDVETDERVKAAMERALARSVLDSDLPVERKRAAIVIMAERSDRDSLSVLKPISEDAEHPLQAEAAAAVEDIENTLALWNAAQNVWAGLSLGSVLLLAAIGLAITFGVMGVINMAHGEMVMLGAYTTFVVQEIIRNSAPELFNWSLAIALPLAFLVTALVGIAIERGIIRYLYGRPLETLLATWGVSLVLQQAVRSVFGATNREVGNPDWMSGAFELGQMTITYNRLWIILFAFTVLFALMLVLRKTPLGLQMRAVTQNRRMAGSMGIRTDRIDALTFGLGSGIAGIAGVALSQIDNVSPNLGQSYIIDSFMVVVFGGVGNLWGTLVGALTLGVANKFLEPYAGAVLAKILVLVFIILFIQKRPRGLFALKGRAVE